MRPAPLTLARGGRGCSQPADKDQELVGEFERRLTADWSERARELLHESAESDLLAARLAGAPLGSGSAASSSRSGGASGGGCSSSESDSGAAPPLQPLQPQACSSSGRQDSGGETQPAEQGSEARPAAAPSREDAGGSEGTNEDPGSSGLHVSCCPRAPGGRERVAAARVSTSAAHEGPSMAPGTPLATDDGRAAARRGVCSSSSGSGGAGGGDGTGCDGGSGSPTAMLSTLRGLGVAQLMDMASAEGAAAPTASRGVGPSGGSKRGAAAGPARPSSGGPASAISKVVSWLK
jgi:hypothetical protein